MEVARPWVSKCAPRKILALRLQSLGDIVISLPFVQALKEKYPGAEFHFLVREEFFSLPAALPLFGKVWKLGGGRSGKRQALSALWLLPQLLWQQYDIVIDLQNNRVSRLIRKSLMTSGWTTFDVASKISAAERTISAIRALRLGSIEFPASMALSHGVQESSRRVLMNTGWDGKSSLIILNPAGAFPTRNWPLRYYPELIKVWRDRIDKEARFVVIGTALLTHKARAIVEAAGDCVIDLTGKTTVPVAFGVIACAKMMISEDSALMHMAWVQRVPTLAIFGSTPSYWSAPWGTWTRCLDSSDLSCGNCFNETCRWGDNRCLTRVQPLQVLEEAAKLLTN